MPPEMCHELPLAHQSLFLPHEKICALLCFQGICLSYSLSYPEPSVFTDKWAFRPAQPREHHSVKLNCAMLYGSG